MVSFAEGNPLSDPHKLPLSELIHQKEADRLAKVLEELDPRAVAREVCELSDEQQAQMLSMMEPAAAAEVLDDLPDVEVTDVVGLLDPGTAASILAELPSDDKADVLGSLESEDAAAILSEMDPRDRPSSSPNWWPTTPTPPGGSWPRRSSPLSRTTRSPQVLETLRGEPDKLRRLDVQYTFVIDHQHRLVGVLRLRDLLLADAGLPIRRVMIQDPLTVPDSAPLAELDTFFEQHSFLGVPVVGPTGRLLGVVSRSAVDEGHGGQGHERLPPVARCGRGRDPVDAHLATVAAAALLALDQHRAQYPGRERDRRVPGDALAGDRPGRLPADHLRHERLQRQPVGRREHA